MVVGSVYEFLDGQYDASIDKHSVSVSELLRSDIAVISDNSQFGPGRPSDHLRPFEESLTSN